MVLSIFKLKLSKSTRLKRRYNTMLFSKIYFKYFNVDINIHIAINKKCIIEIKVVKFNSIKKNITDLN